MLKIYLLVALISFASPCVYENATFQPSHQDVVAAVVYGDIRFVSNAYALCMVEEVYYPVFSANNDYVFHGVLFAIELCLLGFETLRIKFAFPGDRYSLSAALSYVVMFHAGVATSHLMVLAYARTQNGPVTALVYLVSIICCSIRYSDQGLVVAIHSMITNFFVLFVSAFTAYSRCRKYATTSDLVTTATTTPYYHLYSGCQNSDSITLVGAFKLWLWSSLATPAHAGVFFDESIKPDPRILYTLTLLIILIIAAILVFMPMRISIVDRFPETSTSYTWEGNALDFQQLADQTTANFSEASYQILADLNPMVFCHRSTADFTGSITNLPIIRYLTATGIKIYTGSVWVFVTGQTVVRNPFVCTDLFHLLAQTLRSRRLNSILTWAVTGQIILCYAIMFHVPVSSIISFLLAAYIIAHIKLFDLGRNTVIGCAFLSAILNIIYAEARPLPVPSVNFWSPVEPTIPQINQDVYFWAFIIAYAITYRDPETFVRSACAHFIHPLTPAFPILLAIYKTLPKFATPIMVVAYFIGTGDIIFTLISPAPTNFWWCGMVSYIFDGVLCLVLPNSYGPFFHSIPIKAFLIEMRKSFWHAFTRLYAHLTYQYKIRLYRPVDPEPEPKLIVRVQTQAYARLTTIPKPDFTDNTGATILVPPKAAGLVEPHVAPTNLIVHAIQIAITLCLSIAVTLFKIPNWLLFAGSILCAIKGINAFSFLQDNTPWYQQFNPITMINWHNIYCLTLVVIIFTMFAVHTIRTLANQPLNAIPAGVALAVGALYPTAWWLPIIFSVAMNLCAWFFMWRPTTDVWRVVAYMCFANAVTTIATFWIFHPIQTIQFIFGPDNVTLWLAIYIGIALSTVLVDFYASSWFSPRHIMIRDVSQNKILVNEYRDTLLGYLFFSTTLVANARAYRSLQTALQTVLDQNDIHKRWNRSGDSKNLAKDLIKSHNNTNTLDALIEAVEADLPPTVPPTNFKNQVDLKAIGTVETPLGKALGFVTKVDGSLYVVCNEHAVHQQTTITFTSPTGTAKCNVKTSDNTADIAILSIDPKSSLSKTSYITTGPLKIGDRLTWVGIDVTKPVDTHCFIHPVTVGPLGATTGAQGNFGDSGSILLDNSGRACGLKWGSSVDNDDTISTNGVNYFVSLASISRLKFPKQAIAATSLIDHKALFTMEDFEDFMFEFLCAKNDLTAEMKAAIAAKDQKKIEDLITETKKIISIAQARHQKTTADVSRLRNNLKFLSSDPAYISCVGKIAVLKQIIADAKQTVVDAYSESPEATQLAEDIKNYTEQLTTATKEFNAYIQAHYKKVLDDANSTVGHYGNELARVRKELRALEDQAGQNSIAPLRAQAASILIGIEDCKKIIKMCDPDFDESAVVTRMPKELSTTRYPIVYKDDDGFHTVLSELETLVTAGHPVMHPEVLSRGADFGYPKFRQFKKVLQANTVSKEWYERQHTAAAATSLLHNIKKFFFGDNHVHVLNCPYCAHEFKCNPDCTDKCTNQCVSQCEQHMLTCPGTITYDGQLFNIKGHQFRTITPGNWLEHPTGPCQCSNTDKPCIHFGSLPDGLKPNRFYTVYFNGNPSPYCYVSRKCVDRFLAQALPSTQTCFRSIRDAASRVLSPIKNKLLTFADPEVRYSDELRRLEENNPTRGRPQFQGRPTSLEVSETEDDEPKTSPREHRRRRDTTPRRNNRAQSPPRNINVFYTGPHPPRCKCIFCTDQDETDICLWCNTWGDHCTSECAQAETRTCAQCDVTRKRPFYNEYDPVCNCPIDKVECVVCQLRGHHPLSCHALIRKNIRFPNGPGQSRYIGKLQSRKPRSWYLPEQKTRPALTTPRAQDF